MQTTQPCCVLQDEFSVCYESDDHRSSPALSMLICHITHSEMGNAVID
jgi:hypothetical protein